MPAEHANSPVRHLGRNTESKGRIGYCDNAKIAMWGGMRRQPYFGELWGRSSNYDNTLTGEPAKRKMLRFLVRRNFDQRNGEWKRRKLPTKKVLAIRGRRKGGGS